MDEQKWNMIRKCVQKSAISTKKKEEQKQLDVSFQKRKKENCSFAFYAGSVKRIRKKEKSK